MFGDCLIRHVRPLRFFRLKRMWARSLSTVLPLQMPEILVGMVQCGNWLCKFDGVVTQVTSEASVATGR